VIVLTARILGWELGLARAIGAVIFAAFAPPEPGSTGLWPAIYVAKWYISGGLLIILALMLKDWFQKNERLEWVQSTRRGQVCRKNPGQK